MVHALGGFWWACSHHTEGYRWLSRALELGSDAPAAIYAPTLATTGMFAYYLGDAATGKALALRAIDRYGPDADPWDAAHARFVVGGITLGEGDYAAALPEIEAALRSFESLEDRKWVGLLKHLYGVALFGTGDIARSLALLERSLAIQREQRDIWGTGLTLDYIGMVAGTIGDRDRARDAMRQSAEIWQSFGAAVKVSDWLMRVAVITAATAPPERIAHMIGTSEAIRDSLKSVWELPERDVYGACIAANRARLGIAEFERHYLAGRECTPDAAWAFGLETLEMIAGPATTQRVPDEPLPFGLTRREAGVLRLVVAGKTDREIADHLGISHRTAQTHVGNVLGKMQVANRAEAAVVAVKAGFQ
jgi:DNA-binding CsgD family transcriptional regulator